MCEFLKIFSNFFSWNQFNKLVFWFCVKLIGSVNSKIMFFPKIPWNQLCTYYTVIAEFSWNHHQLHFSVKSTHNLTKEYEIGNFHFEHPVTQTKTTFFDLSYPINIFEQIEHFKHAFLNLVLILSYLKSWDLFECLEILSKWWRCFVYKCRVKHTYVDYTQCENISNLL